MRVATVKYLSGYRKHRYKLVEETKKSNPKKRRVLASKVIMDCGTTTKHKFRTKLGFKQSDTILTIE